MRGVSWALAGVLSAGLIGCGGDDDGPDPLIGTFEVSSHTLSEMGCDMPNPLLEPSSCFGCAVAKPFFKVKRQSLFGSSFLSVVDCDSATVCDDADADPDSIDLGGALLDRKEGGAWVGTAYGASYGGASCSYSEIEWRLSETEDGVQLVRTTLRNTPESASGMLQGEACLDLTDNPPPRDELVCDALETITGVAAGE